MSGRWVQVVPELTGRELDAEVAERVMKFEEVERVSGTFYYHNVKMDLESETGGRWRSPVPAFSTSIAAALEVVEKMLGAFTFDCGSYNGRTWQATFHSVEKIIRREAGSATNEIARSLPEAICLAALAALKTQDTNTDASSGTT